jgi:hypothetical protein
MPVSFRSRGPEAATPVTAVAKLDLREQARRFEVLERVRSAGLSPTPLASADRIWSGRGPTLAGASADLPRC